MKYLDTWAAECPDKVWLRERCGDEVLEWNWARGAEEIYAMGAWQEQNMEGQGHRIGLLSRNRAHWFFADMGSICLLYTSDAADD